MSYWSDLSKKANVATIGLWSDILVSMTWKSKTYKLEK